MPRYGGIGYGYIMMAGMYGYMPEYRLWFRNKKDAVAGTIDTLESEFENFAFTVEWEDASEPEREEWEANLADAKRSVRKYMSADLGDVFGERGMGWEYIEIAEADDLPDEDELY